MVVELGPIGGSEFPDRKARDALCAAGLAMWTTVRGIDCTPLGRICYLRLHPGADGPAETVRQARANRITASLLRKLRLPA